MQQINSERSCFFIEKKHYFILRSLVTKYGKDLSGQTTAVVRDREILSKDGLIAVVISIESQNNQLLTS
ncbi:hypothetical protein, partial [Spiroplasma phoeniceum]|uniref:hypothetical protein n=1 Tax=Spiroplasma phoeniceum TaxID=47835 RepID=UPI003364E8C0